MKSKIIYFICGLLAVTIIAATTAPMWQPPRHDDTFIGVGTDDEPLGGDTVDWLATKYDLTSLGGGTPGFEEVLIEDGVFTQNNSVNTNGFTFSAGSYGSGLNIYAGGGLSEIGDYTMENNGNRLGVSDPSNYCYYDKNGHNGMFGINTIEPNHVLDIKFNEGQSPMQIYDIQHDNQILKFGAIDNSPFFMFDPNNVGFNVGIGTANPESKLDVIGGSRSSLGYKTSGDDHGYEVTGDGYGTSYGLFYYDADVGGHIRLYDENAGSHADLWAEANRIFIDGPLYVAGAVQFDNYTAGIAKFDADGNITSAPTGVALEIGGSYVKDLEMGSGNFTTTSPTNDVLFSMYMGDSEEWEFSADIKVGSSNSGGLTFAVTHNGTPFLLSAYVSGTTSAAGTIAEEAISSSGTLTTTVFNTAGLTTAAVGAFVHIKGYVITTTGGYVTIDVAKVGGGTATVYAGSHIVYTRKS